MGSRHSESDRESFEEENEFSSLLQNSYGDEEEGQDEVIDRNGAEIESIRRKKSVWRQMCAILDLPSNVVPALFMSMLEAWNTNTIWPFLPAMVASLGVEEEKIGYYAGFVGAAFFAGQALTGYLYGILADAIGRRPVMVIGTLGTAIGCLLFGFRYAA